MDINQIKSNLQMKYIFFSNYSFSRDVIISAGDCNIDLQKRIKKIKDHEYQIILKTEIKKQDLHLELETLAEFIYDADDYSKEETIINANTVAIMFPFIRSQVTLMTSQPGMAPIVLPPINALKLE